MPELTRVQIMALVPHAGAMCLLDRVLEWDADHIRCCSDSYHRDPGHPLHHAGRLAAINLVEYGAQAAAVHSGLLASQSSERYAPGGFLAGLRDVVLNSGPVDAISTPLDVYAYREMGGAQGMIYRFAVDSDGATRCSGRLTIVGNA